MRVKTYDLFLDVDFKGLKFAGKVLIDLESESDIVLNSSGLDIVRISAGKKRFRFEQRGEDLVAKTGPFVGRLEIEYTGPIRDSLTGIYRAPYDSTHMVTTQFEAVHARTMLPCVDNPGYKAEFKVAVKVDKDLKAISNMPVDSVETDGAKKTVSFQKTPTMSTYLLYLGIGKFEEVRDRLGDVDVIVATTPGKAAKGRFAMEVAKRSIEFYQSYFGIPYMLPKVHLIAVPEFAAGAMENWGAITFREVELLIDENSSLRVKKRVAEVVAHELAHMWFGNLVTMRWWDDLWLNESFATYLAYKAVDAAYPQWLMWDDFIDRETSAAMSRDSLRNTHPIQAEVKSPAEIEQVFDDISYGKGASILRMLEAYIGSEGFRKGVASYLERYRFSNAVGSDFWRSLEEASGKKIATIMEEWVKKPGYPVLTAEVQGSKLKVRQARFVLSGRPEKGVWPVPVTMRLDGRSRALLLDREERIVDIRGAKSLKLNVDQTGFYRVYSQGLQERLSSGEPSALDRWGRASDALAFLMAGMMSFGDYLALIHGYYDERDHLPALEVSSQLALLYSIAQSGVARVSGEFHRSQLDILSGKSDENARVLQGIVAARLAVVDDSYAKQLGSGFRCYEKVPPDMRQAVATAYARAYADFEGILMKYRKSDSDEEKLRLLRSMMSFKDESLVSLSLGLAKSGEVKRQDVRAMILAAAGNPEARDTAWKWLRDNIEMLRRLYEGTGNLSSVLLSVVPLLGVGRVDETERFFEQSMIPEAEKGIDAGLERLRVYDRLVKSI